MIHFLYDPFKYPCVFLFCNFNLVIFILFFLGNIKFVKFELCEILSFFIVLGATISGESILNHLHRILLSGTDLVSAVSSGTRHAYNWSLSRYIHSV